MNTIIFSANLKKFREQKGLTKSELAKRVGVSDVTIGYWESGKNEPRMGKVEMVAEILGVSTDDLLFGGSSFAAPVLTKQMAARQIATVGNSGFVPLYGSIAAGLPLEMIPVDDYVEVPMTIADRYPGAFLLRVNGDSMNKIVPNGAYALIIPCDEIKNGEIAAVAVNGHDATLKRFHRLNNSIALEPDSYNPEHTAKLYDMNVEDSSTLKIIGKMVWFMSPFDAKY